jgi:hypothetical protein
MYANRSLICCRANHGFVPAIRLTPLGSPNAVPSFLGSQVLLSFKHQFLPRRMFFYTLNACAQGRAETELAKAEAAVPRVPCSALLYGI